MGARSVTTTTIATTRKGTRAITHADNTITRDVPMVGQRIQSGAGTALITSGEVGGLEGMRAADYLA